MISTPSNEYKYRLLKNTEGDTYKAILMATDFVFNKDTHSTYADVSASELATGNGYTTGGITLTGVTITKNNDSDKGIFSANDAVWTASGGALSAGSAIILNNTMTNAPVVYHIDFVDPVNLSDGINLRLKGIELNILS